MAYKPHSVKYWFPVYTLRLLPGPHAWAIISLSSLPGTNNEAGRFSSLLGLAPDGGCLAARIAADAGGLLHRLFTMTLSLALPRWGRGRREGCLFLWP